jgi:large subunit ribosomal protein L25
MERIALHAEIRDKAGKGTARSLRRQDMIPAVIYRGGASTPIRLGKKELTSLIKSTGGERVVVNLVFPDGANKLALLKEYQVDPVLGELLHTDFFEVSLSEKVRVTVKVSLTGEPLGVKRDGGILQHGLREIEVECLPDRIPGHVEADVSGLLTAHSMHVSDLRLPEGIKVLTVPSEVIATVTAPAVEKAAAPTEEAAAAAAEKKEPEVIKKGKEEKEKEKA